MADIDSKGADEPRLTPDGFLIATRQQGTDRISHGEASGLIALAASALPLTPVAGFWREMGAEFLRALCHVPENAPLVAGALDPPSEATLASWVLNAPPMDGGEYLTPAVLSAIWKRLQTWASAETEALGGVGSFLEKHAPKWSRVGRVTLHLAENKGDDECPFAFMATYAAGLTPAGRVRRLPLGKALTEYAGAKKKTELLHLLSPLHEAAKRSDLIADLIETGDIFHPLAWSPPEAYAFLREIPHYEEAGLIALLPNWWRKRTRPQVRVSIDTNDAGNLGLGALMDFDIDLALGDQTMTKQEAKALLRGQAGLVQLHGEWVEVDPDRLREALDHWEAVQAEVAEGGISFVEGMRLLAGAPADLADRASEGGEVVAWSMVGAGDRLRGILADLRTPSGLEAPPPAGLCGTLRDYQLAGYRWLSLCSRLGLGACLADDMGLGKTVQVIAALLLWKEEQPAGHLQAPALLVVPASLIGNWKSEVARFAPSLRIRIAHSSETARVDLDALASDPTAALAGIDLVITTYTMVSRLSWIAGRRWDWVILDEAQAIKNPGTRQTKAIKKIPAASRVALTGTPVENRIGDLWSIIDFLNPGLLGSASRFKSFVKSLSGESGAHFAPLRNLVAPYILRRMKTDPDIVPDLPDKTEMQVFCGLSKPQATLYNLNVSALTKALEKASSDGIQRRGLVLSYLMRFKQICNHPSQLTGDGSYEPTASAKFLRLGEITFELASRGERALVFTQFREIVAPLADFLATSFGRPGLTLHGGTPVGRRKDRVAAFQEPGGPPFMVISVKAGGTGLNLTAASHVIHFDRWWNPAIENQATDRAFRIGQQSNVLVHKFVTLGTIEEKIDALIRDKQKMSDAILQGGGEKALTEMSDDEILDMVTLDLNRSGVGAGAG